MSGDRCRLAAESAILLAEALKPFNIKVCIS
jgi:hypothetical protein